MTDDRPIPQRMPVVQKTAPGTYWWCACGRSQNQPFCDGSHVKSGYEPKEIEIEEEATIAWCACKRSGNGAFCDGSHSRIPR